MFISQLRATNWRNFPNIDVALRERQFVVGANASGKSNFLDIFRFLRDIAKPEGGGLQKALKDRGGLGKVRSLAARKHPNVAIDITLSESSGSEKTWRYALSVRQQQRALRLPIVEHERVWFDGELLLSRPNEDDKHDPARLTQTFLEQIGANATFREIPKFLQSITYLHLVPQLLRFADQIQGRIVEDDPFGQSFLERVARTPEKRRKSRFRVIEGALKIAVPQLEQLQFIRDSDTGRPHLQALYSHWRPNAGWQQEDQFSDGTLRLIGLLWALLDGDSLLLLEEPELSLNAGIVSQLAPLIHRAQKAKKRQVIVSTHSDSLLTEKGIDGREVLLLSPDVEGTRIDVASNIREVKELLDAGLSVGEVILPRAQSNAIQLPLIEVR
jgi:predicted ATPase